MKGYSARQVRDAEAPHLAAGEPLMARASAALAAECERMLARGPSGGVPGAFVAVLAGGGNNGGDALHAGAALARAGARVGVIPTSGRLHEEGLAAALDAGAIMLRGAPEELADQAAQAELIVDGILGTGTSADPRLRDPARAIVAALAPKAAERRGHGAVPVIVAVDIPSGIHPDTGAVPDPAAVLHADVTVTFGGAKAGLLLPPGADFAGAVQLHEIGLAPELARLPPLVDAPENTAEGPDPGGVGTELRPTAPP